MRKLFESLLPILLVAYAILALPVMVYLLFVSTSDANETRYKVAIIDTGIDLRDPRFKDYVCSEGHKDFTSTGLEDEHGHGTHIAGIIAQHAGRPLHYCFLIYKYTSVGIMTPLGDLRTLFSIQDAIAAGASFLNYSSGGTAHSEDEKKAFIQATQVMTVSVCAGNNSTDLDKPGAHESLYYPASYRITGMHVVGNLKPDGKERAESSDWGSVVTDWEIGQDVLSTLPPLMCRGLQGPVELKKNCTGYMSGTSMSTAVLTGKLVRKFLEAKHLYVPSVKKPNK